MDYAKFFAIQQANYTTYGVLYNWFVALPACPTGWHLPTENEWQQLEIAIGMSQSEADNSGFRGTYEGTKLKATNGWNNNGKKNVTMFGLNEIIWNALCHVISFIYL